MKSFNYMGVSDWIQFIQLNHSDAPFSIRQLRRKYGSHYKMERAFEIVKQRWLIPSHCEASNIRPQGYTPEWHHKRYFEFHGVTEQFYKFSSRKLMFNK